MSVSHSLLLLLLLLCLSLHACNAGRLMTADKKLEKVRNSNQDDQDQKEPSPIAPKVDPSSSDEGASTNIDVAAETKVKDIGDQKMNQLAEKQKLMRDAKARISGAGKRVSLVSASRSVPRSKRSRERHPGFNLDYESPKTHPPSHN